jgi:hypothetical protein
VDIESPDLTLKGKFTEKGRSMQAARGSDRFLRKSLMEIIDIWKKKVFDRGLWRTDHFWRGHLKHHQGVVEEVRSDLFALFEDKERGMKDQF